MSFIISLHFLWIVLAAANLAIQVAYFYSNSNRTLFMAKKATTPLLLFSGLLIVVFHTRSFPVIPCAILAAMGLGELGIEGSDIVEAGEKADSRTPLTVTLAGVLFLLVNVFIGLALMMRNCRAQVILSALAVAACIIALAVFLLLRFSRPDPETRFQILAYSAGLVVLLSGVLADAPGGLSALGKAAAILTLSDSLVLIRMGAGIDKEGPSGFRALLGFLVVILLLYYVFMGMLIHMGSPFPW